MKKTKEQLMAQKEKALNSVADYLSQLIESDDDRKRSKADKLCYWLCDYMDFLTFEAEFRPNSLRKYKRGEIIKAHLGYNVGSEEGGLHYCVVVDKCNSVNSPVVTVVPLTSVKPKTDISKLHPPEVYLGNELFTNLNSKIISHKKATGEEVQALNNIVDAIKVGKDSEQSREIIEEVNNRITLAVRRVEFIERMESEVRNMKKGSIALVNQITTISKIRIYDPKRNDDVLSNIKLSNEKLDLIDDVISQHYSNLMQKYLDK